MKKLNVCVIDLTTKSASASLWGRVMNANLAGIMPQIVATWCEQEGHNVTLVTYTGSENLAKDVPYKVDIAFISAFSQSALLAYALSARFRANGAVTVIGGPHARCFPQDACKYFDYVLGFTNKDLIRGVLQDCSPYRPVGQYLEVDKQPDHLPGVRERWKFIEQTLRKAPMIKMVGMLGSMGCPYTCAFCIDSTVPYQPISTEIIKEDLRFLLTKFKRPRVGWHDPNFGIRFNESLGAIEEAVPPNSIDFISESSLSLLSEPHLKRLKHNGFKAVLPGIESWFDLGNKSKTGRKQGLEKVKQVSEHVNMILSYIPYIQTNFVLGLDSDEGDIPFDLTKEFIDRSPGAFPGYSLLSAFGRAAPLNLTYQREKRVLPFPFHFLDNNHAMNVKPKNYSWTDFYDRVIDLTAYTFSWKKIYHRFRAGGSTIPKWMNLLRAISSEGFGRLKYYKQVRKLLETDSHFRDYFEGRTTELHPFYTDQIKNDLQEMWDWLPEGAMFHDSYAYLKSELAKETIAK